MTAKQIFARFFETTTGRSPVREWLLDLTKDDRKAVGDTIRTAEFGWPIGMPICRSLSGHKGLWEVRASLSNGRIARVCFCIVNDEMILLHGFIKKSQKTPKREIETAIARMKGL